MSAAAPAKTTVRWVVPAALGIPGVVLLVGGALVLQDAQSQYDARLAHDCVGMNCTALGPLNSQPDYLVGLGLVAAGLLLVVAGFGAYAWLVSRRRGSA